MRHTVFPLTTIVALLSLGVFSYGAFFSLTPKPVPVPMTAHVKRAAHGGRARPASANISPGLPANKAIPDLSLKLMQAGGIGLILCVFLALGLARSVLSTQFATAQSFLKDERKAWEKKQGVYDAQRDQLIAELQEAQTKKTRWIRCGSMRPVSFRSSFKRFPSPVFALHPAARLSAGTRPVNSSTGFRLRQCCPRPCGIR